MKPIEISRALAQTVNTLRFAPPVTHVYNPLDYARASHEAYLERYARAPKQVLFVGMNPGPFGMAQTGVPFGDVAMVRDWLRLSADIDKPAAQHPKRPIHGFECARSEVSGTRLWSWARDRFTTPEAFFNRFFVWNYCPLCFMEQSGRNRTPEKLPRSERDALFEACDDALVRLVDYLEPEYVIGVGKFAEDRAREALAGRAVTIGRIPHPSPASPAANQGWPEAVDRALRQIGVCG